MKSTQERLSEVYCRTNEIEWKAIELIDDDRVIRHYRDWSICATAGSLSGRTEIPVSHFIDLLKDRIDAPWRLLEDGFRATPWKCTTVYEIDFAGKRSLSIIDGTVTVWNDEDDSASKGVPMIGIETYTDLLAQIRFLG